MAPKSVKVHDISVGDLIEIERDTYAHWAVYIGNGRIIHLTGEPLKKMNSKVQEDSLRGYAKEAPTYRNNEFDDEMSPLEKSEIVLRARGKLGTGGYDLALYNCEHFATECRYGKARSKQVESFVKKLYEGLVPYPLRYLISGVAAPVKYVVDTVRGKPAHPGDLVIFE